MVHFVLQARLEKRPHPTRTALFAETLTYQASVFALPLRLIIANWWCFGWLLTKIFVSKPKTAGVLRTTTAVTIMSAGVKINVIPNRATAWVNHCVHPHDSLKDVIEFDRKVIAEPRVKLRISGLDEVDDSDTQTSSESSGCSPDGKGCVFTECGHYDGSAEALQHAVSQVSSLAVNIDDGPSLDTGSGC